MGRHARSRPEAYSVAVPARSYRAAEVPADMGYARQLGSRRQVDEREWLRLGPVQSDLLFWCSFPPALRPVPVWRRAEGAAHVSSFLFSVSAGCRTVFSNFFKTARAVSGGNK